MTDEPTDCAISRADGIKIGALWAAALARTAANRLKPATDAGGFDGRTHAASCAALRALAAEIEALFDKSPINQSSATLPPAMLPVPHSVETVDIDAHRAQARAQGYTGDECRECGSFSMVRNGTCLKCENCGATTGCS